MVLFGVRDLIVVDTGDAILIAHREGRRKSVALPRNSSAAGCNVTCSQCRVIICHRVALHRELAQLALVDRRLRSAS